MQELSFNDIKKIAHIGWDKKLYVRIRDVWTNIKRRVKVFKYEQVKEKYMRKANNIELRQGLDEVEATRLVTNRVPDGEGIFHQWGMNYEEIEGHEGYTAGNYTVAIVEMPDGTIKSVAAEDIEFIS